MTSKSKSINSNGGMMATTTQPRSFVSATETKHQIKQWMQQCRTATLTLFETVDHETMCRQAHEDFSPIGWHLGHIAYTESLWILEHLAGETPQFPQYRRLFAADTLPKNERVYLPTYAEICEYLDRVRTQVFAYLETAPIHEQERLWLWLLQHESQHSETISLVLQLQTVAGHWSNYQRSIAPSSSTSLSAEMVEIPAGVFWQGSAAIVAQDNERSTHEVFLPTYWLDRYPVTCAQYREFMAAGGYRDSAWWSPQGWQWLQQNPVEKPLYWSDGSALDNYPVWGVSYYEAEAYAQFVGKRLPTEAEWEKAARWHPATGQARTYPWGETEPVDRCNHNCSIGYTSPVDAYPNGQSAYGCYDMLGNVWEWTSSIFNGYNQFVAYPYRGYSQAYFDGQHRVLRGGSWATRPFALRATFRNWYHSQVRQIFAGFRCAKDED